MDITAFRVHIRVIDTIPVKDGLSGTAIDDNGHTALLHTIVGTADVTSRQGESHRIITSLVGHVIVGIVGVVVGHSPWAHCQQAQQQEQAPKHTS